MTDLLSHSRISSNTRPGVLAAVCAGGWWRVLLLCCWLAVVVGVVQPAAAQLDAQSSGKRALSRGSFPWYDSDADRLKRIQVVPPDDDFLGRHSNWKRDKKPQTPNARTNRNRGSAFSEAMQVLVWVLASILLTVIIALLIWAFLNRQQKSAQGDAAFGEETPAAEVQVDRIEELPVPINAVHGDLLQQAKAHYAQGNLRDAIICLFSYKLLQLDNQHAIHLERGKTNRQYLRELRTRPRLRELLEGTMIAFEDVFFGNHVLTNDRFETCLSQVDEFQQAIRGAG